MEAKARPQAELLGLLYGYCRDLQRMFLITGRYIRHMLIRDIYRKVRASYFGSCSGAYVNMSVQWAQLDRQLALSSENLFTSSIVVERLECFLIALVLW